MKKSLRVLVIEDDADTLSNLRDILELDGYHVVVAPTFQTAQRLAADQVIDVVISDRRLPDCVIEEKLPEIRAFAGEAEIIVITGYADMESTIAAFRQGVSDYVIKPIIPDDLRSTMRRISETRQLEAAMQQQHAFADQVLSTAEAIVLVLDLNGNVIRFNPYFQQLTGWTTEELTGKNWFQYCIPDDDDQRLKEAFIRTARDTKTRGIVNKVVDRSGGVHPIRWSNTTLKNGEGDVEAVLAVGIDVSDVAEAQSRAMQAERLAAIGQTMTALAHESRNALQRIQAASEVLALEIEGNASAANDLKAIQRAGRDLQCLLEEVRSFAAPIQIHPVTIKLPNVWRRAWADIETLRRGRDATLSEWVADGFEEVVVDVVRMEQVFRNLFENSLAAGNDPVRLKVHCQDDNGQVQIRICDNGPGLNSQQREKLFEPFFTTKSTGTGLGLPISQRIIDAHGGTIQVELLEPLGSGTSFVILLPR